jgi:phospholipase A1/A2
MAIPLLLRSLIGLLLLLLWCVFVEGGAILAATLPLTTLSKDNVQGGVFRLRPYDSNYFLVTQTRPINSAAWHYARRYADHLRRTEAKFQFSGALSIQDRCLGDDSWLGFSYTQRVWWQALSPKISSPFRETNYEPQLFIAWRTTLSRWGWQFNQLELGFNHHSNGCAYRTSRSWNRFYARCLAQQGQWHLDLKSWIRLPEGAGDDNPDITRYLGHYQLQIAYRFGNRSRIYLKHHYRGHSGYGGYELGGHYPLTRGLHLYLQWFNGYGESLIDYNFRQSRLGIGLILDWFPPCGE